MAEPSDDQVAQVSRGAWIDQIADRFEAAWQSGSQEPRIADFLGDSTGIPRRELLAELVALDREYRRRRGAAKPWGAYAAEFPELGDEPATGQATADTTDFRSGQKP